VVGQDSYEISPAGINAVQKSGSPAKKYSADTDSFPAAAGKAGILQMPACLATFNTLLTPS
jgi:hypothetical protein